MFSIGVDLGGTNLRIAAVEESGHVLETIITGTAVAGGRDNVINAMCDAILALEKKFASTHKLAGIGIGVPGIIEMSTGMLRESPNLPGWANYPVKAEIERRLSTTVILENDANAACLGEAWLGAARGFDSCCMFTLGTGVGGGLVFNGRVWHGMTGMAGELGHISVYPEGQLCGCGNRGCLEQYASATAIKRMALEAIGTGSAAALGKAMQQNAELTSQMVYQLAIQGDKPAQEIFRKVGEALGLAIAGFINALNLPIYVIGGGVSAGFNAFQAAMYAEIRKRSFVYVATNPDPDVVNPGGTIVIPAMLGGDAGILGAARLPMLITSE